MAKTALVLGGGGARGAFQFMAEKYAREHKGYVWDVIAGVSVGALNGTMLAMKKYERLEEIWRTITRDRVMTGRMGVWAIFRMMFGAKSIYGNSPLWNLIQQEIDPAAVGVDLRIGVVSLRTGEYVRFEKDDPGFAKAVLASTAIPIVWEPVEVSAEYADMVDGGVRNVSPLGDVLDTDPDEVVVINCSPMDPPRLVSPLKDVLAIGRHALDIALNEIFVTDVREFTRINRNVQEAAQHGVTLHNEEGKPYKFYNSKIIEPDSPLDDTLDFSRQALERSMEKGLAKAIEVLG
jgi:NTE family protein